ncbi:MAG: hypothetical protein ACP5H8_01165, partial [Candidatus Micrarchaeia archaeon]
FVSATNALRAGALVKYAKEILAGAGGYMETGEAEGGGAAAYISNKEQTLFALASLLGQKQYGWIASTAARYIGEAMGAKVVGVYDNDEENKDNTVYVGSELSFNNLGFADEIRLYYVAGKKVDNALKQIQQIGGVDYLKGKFEVEVAGGAGDVLGEGMVSKVWLYNIIDKADFKLHITGLFGELKGGEGIGVEGTLWTGGLGLGLQAGRLRLVAIPISYWKDTGTGITSYETSLFGRYYLTRGRLDFFGGLMIQDMDYKIDASKLWEKKNRLELPYHEIPLMDPEKKAHLLELGLGGGFKGIIFDENSIHLIFMEGENPEVSFYKVGLQIKGIKYSGLETLLNLDIGQKTYYIQTQTFTNQDTTKTAGSGTSELIWDVMFRLIYNF